MKKRYLYDNLVFEGGGVKTIAYAGAIKILEEKGILSNIQRFSGSSSGSIMALYLAVGLSPKKIEEILLKADLRKINNTSIVISRHLSELYKSFGWNNGDNLRNWLRKSISERVNPNITFSELKKIHPNKELHIVASNITKRKRSIFNHENTPDLPIVEAVRISSGIPLLFSAIKIKEEYYVDGGIYCNYPIDLFDNVKYLNSKIRKSHHKKGNFNLGTLGLYIKEPNESDDRYYRNKKNEKISSLQGFVYSLIDGITCKANQRNLHSADFKRTIQIKTGDIKANDFAISLNDKKRIIRAGASATRFFFRN